MTAAGEAIGPLLAARLWRQDDACAALCTQLVRLLADGQPVSRDRLAAALGCSRTAVDTTLRQVANLATDERDDIIAAGLCLVPTPHQFQVNGHALYTWCALDTLLYPLVLGQSAQVASRCPVSGTTVRLTATPTGVLDLDPATAVVSLVLPAAADACGDVRGAFCQHVHVFAGPEAGAAWQAAYPEVTLLSVEDASTVARLLAQTRYRLSPS